MHPADYDRGRTQRTCLRRYREYVSTHSSFVPGFPDEPAARPGPAGLAGPSPPLTMRLRRIHWVTLDYVLAAVCAVIIFGLLYKGGHAEQPPFSGVFARDWLAPLLAVGLAVPVAIRRRDPVVSFVLVLALCGVVLWLDGRITRGPILPLALVLFLVAATRSRRAALAALAASLVLCAVQGLILHLDGSGAGNAVGVGLVLIIVWMVGYSVRQRRAYAARLRQQATDHAVTAERLRIARELHDVVAHSMTVVAVQAGFGEYVFDRQPAQARSAPPRPGRRPRPCRPPAGPGRPGRARAPAARPAAGRAPPDSAPGRRALARRPRGSRPGPPGLAFRPRSRPGAARRASAACRRAPPR